MVRSELVNGSVGRLTDLWMLSRTSRAEATESVKRAGLPRSVCALRKDMIWGSSCMGLLPFLRVTQFETLFFNFLAQFEDAFDQRLGTGRAAGDIDIDRNNGIDALHGIITIVELPTRIGALAHAYHPLRLWHLFPQQAQARSHFDGDRSGDHHQIGLPGTGTEYLGAKAGQIILWCGSRGD